MPTKSGLLQMSQGCSHCDFVADIWNAPSFGFPTVFQGYSRESFLELQSSSDVTPLDQIQLRYWHCKQKHPLRERGRLENDPQLVPGFQICCSWMFPEQLRNKTKIVGVRGNSSSLEKAPKTRDSVRVTSWKSVLMLLPSIVSETWVMIVIFILRKMSCNIACSRTEKTFKISFFVTYMNKLANQEEIVGNFSNAKWECRGLAHNQCTVNCK